MVDFPAELTACAADVEAGLDAILEERALAAGGMPPARLVAAMRHGTLGGGKRLRPLLVRQSAALFGVDARQSLPAGLALELVHCYSLVHDDLPAMDDDDVRRGRPTVHRAFDEATAILAGDALLTEAFGVLARMDAPPDVRAALVATLARAAGAGGMIGGQMRDIEGESKVALEAHQIETMQAMKTGALFSGAVEMGAILGRASPAESAALAAYGRAAGRSFQLTDDLLDVTAPALTLGKATGKDAGLGKQTLVGLLGIDGARERLSELVHDALSALAPFGERAASLRETVVFIAMRDR